jgi:hypothetical protein
MSPNVSGLTTAGSSEAASEATGRVNRLSRRASGAAGDALREPEVIRRGARRQPGWHAYRRPPHVSLPGRQASRCPNALPASRATCVVEVEATRRLASTSYAAWAVSRCDCASCRRPRATSCSLLPDGPHTMTTVHLRVMPAPGVSVKHVRSRAQTPHDPLTDELVGGDRESLNPRQRLDPSTYGVTPPGPSRAGAADAESGRLRYITRWCGRSADLHAMFNG